MSLVSELRRRNVIRVGIAYVVVAWLVAQVLQLVFQSFGTPDWVMKTLLVLMAAGLVFALFFAWAFELTPEGLKRESEVDRTQSITQATGRKLDFLIIAVLVIALAWFAFDKFAPGTREPAVVAGPAIAPAEAEGTEAPIKEAPQSIAVLPFVNMSEDASNEYFSDGLSEEILNLLSRIRELKVIARTSSFAFKGRNEDLRTIGAALGVNHVLEGSVRKSGDRIRVTAQLIDVSDGSHLWSNTFDRTLTDIFAIQDEVAGAIVEALQLHVGSPERGRPTDSTEAYALYLKARQFMSSFWTPEVMDLLQKSIELDPGFAEAHELMALGYWNMAGTQIKSGEGMRLTFGAAQRALEANPDLVLAKALWVSANYSNYSYLAELEALEAAIRQQPGNVHVLNMLSFDLGEAGYFEEAVFHARQSVEHDPLALSGYARLAETLWAAGRKGEVRPLIESGRQRIAAALTVPHIIAFADFADGNIEAAAGGYAAMLQKLFGFRDTAWVVEALQRGGDVAEGPAYLDQLIAEKMAELPEDRRFDFWRIMVLFHLLLGHVDRYFEIINEIDLTSSVWTDADWLMYMGHVLRDTGFTAHPKYLELAEVLGIVNIWEHRGPPDHCRKVEGEWVCQ